MFTGKSDYCVFFKIHLGIDIDSKHSKRRENKRHWAKPRGYEGWRSNALRVHRLQEFHRSSPKSTRSMLWLAQSHSRTKLNMGALTLRYHPTYTLELCTTVATQYVSMPRYVSISPKNTLGRCVSKILTET